ncbi:2-dehydropantoate 2-reductase [Nocardioides aromaticivorans]|uniref:2-dehydropantoate 2-reductase n=1 Tax=Nocardioides aromaticivorans TaxID=200618 RepID=A0A7Y9ZIJ1_9ACTN|nr:2-dehydropantoate 2-reductase [Nocardioides aromaticivorans]NYI45033.1 2-dehydropantoate 2-reductase [Nocardioides aromaticivorans]
MKYLIVGAGAMGSALSAFLAKAGKDVTLVARGDNLAAVRENGLRVRLPDGNSWVQPVPAVAESEYTDVPDVVVVCVKAYSLDSVVPLLDRISGPDTMILPIINGLNVGDRIEGAMRSSAQIAEGVAYVAVQLTGAGEVTQKLDLFRFVLGARNGHEAPSHVGMVASDLRDAGMTVEVSSNMLRDALRKFVRVSTLSAAEVLYDAHAGGVRENPESMAYLMELAGELLAIAEAAGIPLDGDPAGELRTAVNEVHPEYTTSLMLDHENGRRAEFESQFFDVVELGRSLGLPMDAYARVSQKVGYVGARG